VVRDILAEPETRARMVALGVEAEANLDSEVFARAIQAESKQYGDIIRKLNLKID